MSSNANVLKYSTRQKFSAHLRSFDICPQDNYGMKFLVFGDYGEFGEINDYHVIVVDTNK